MTTYSAATPRNPVRGPISRAVSMVVLSPIMRLATADDLRRQRSSLRCCVGHATRISLPTRAIDSADAGIETMTVSVIARRAIEEHRDAQAGVKFRATPVTQ